MSGTLLSGLSYEWDFIVPECCLDEDIEELNSNKIQTVVLRKLIKVPNLLNYLKLVNYNLL